MDCIQLNSGALPGEIKVRGYRVGVPSRKYPSFWGSARILQRLLARLLVALVVFAALLGAAAMLGLLE